MVGAEVRLVPQQQSKLVRTFGTVYCGLELMTTAWGTLDHVFLIRHQPLPEVIARPTTKVYLGAHRNWGVLRKHPVDILVVEQGHLRRAPRGYKASIWMNMVTEAPINQKPVVIIEAWAPHAQM